MTDLTTSHSVTSPGAIALRALLSIGLPAALGNILLSLSDTGFLALASASVALVVFLRGPRTRASKLSRETEGTFGTAEWADRRDMRKAGLLDGRGLILGRVPPNLSAIARWRAWAALYHAPLSESSRTVRELAKAWSFGLISAAAPLVRLSDYVHILTVAATGAGKGTGLVIPNLLNYPSSVVVVDPKGENYQATAQVRSAVLRQEVILLDPFGEIAEPSATFNPFDLIEPSSDAAMEDARALANAIVVRDPQERDPHWNESAQDFLQVLIAFICAEARPAERNLNTLADLLSRPETLRSALRKAANSEWYGRMLRRKAARFVDINEKELLTVISTARRHTDFVNAPRVAANLASSSFDFRALGDGSMSIYLVLPARYLKSQSGLMRLWVYGLLRTLEDGAADRSRPEVLYVLDEVAQLGQLEYWEKALTLLRGYGARLWFFLQSVEQLETIFGSPHAAETAKANFGTKIYFGIRDTKTAEEMSKMSGDTTRYSHSHSEGTSHSMGAQAGDTSFVQNVLFDGSTTRSSSSSRSEQRVPLLAVGEVLGAPNELCYVFTSDARAPRMRLQRVTHYRDPEFAAADSLRK